MRSRRWRSIQSGLPESAHGSPELVKHALLIEVDGMSRNTRGPCRLDPARRMTRPGTRPDPAGPGARAVITAL